MTRVALLDVNVLIALFDPDHVHHEAAHRWFGVHREQGWASCPLTENGVVRVLSQPAYSPTAERPAQILDRLRSLRGSGGHEFWADELSLCDPAILYPGAPRSHRQVTDVYLLALAVRREGCLASFDTTLSIGSVRGASAEHLALLQA